MGAHRCLISERKTVSELTKLIPYFFSSLSVLSHLEVGVYQR